VPLDIEEKRLGQGPPKGHGVAPSSSVEEGEKWRQPGGAAVA